MTDVHEPTDHLLTRLLTTVLGVQCGHHSPGRLGGCQQGACAGGASLVTFWRCGWEQGGWGDLSPFKTSTPTPAGPPGDVKEGKGTNCDLDICQQNKFQIYVVMLY